MFSFGTPLSFYGQGDRERLPPLPPLPPLQSTFCDFFLSCVFIVEYDYMCSETDFTQEKSHFHLRTRIPNSSLLFAAALSQNGRIAV